MSRKQSGTRVFQTPRNVVESSGASRSVVKKPFLASKANGKRVRMTFRLSQIGSTRHVPFIAFDDCTSCGALLAYGRTRKKAAQKRGLLIRISCCARDEGSNPAQYSPETLFLARLFLLVARALVVVRLRGVGELGHPLIDGKRRFGLEHILELRMRLGIARHEQRAAIGGILR